MDTFITLARFETGLEAHIIKGRLEAEGIDCILLDENYIGLNTMISSALGGIRLQVHPEQFERAKQILSEIANGTMAPPDDNT